MWLFSESLYFLLPLLIAGIIHHFLIIKFNLISFLAKPIDLGHTFNGERILGKSKTFRGLIIVTTISSLVMWVLSFFFQIPLKFPSAVSGFILGLGYSLAELPNSFFKRRLKVPEGTTPKRSMGIVTYAIDQVDSIFGAIVALNFIYTPTLLLTLFLFSVGVLLHMTIDAILYVYGYKKNLLIRRF
jgi:CDP-diacylglycerol--serine O-phosphatidyltransferase